MFFSGNDETEQRIPYSIYIHVPFCLTRCIYCNFFTQDNILHLLEEYVNSLCYEIQLISNKNVHEDGKCQTIYFGGGTPSLLTEAHLKKILNAIKNALRIKNDAEITLECNPQDLNAEILGGYRASGVNRLSIGCQSFNDSLLQALSRRHTAAECHAALELSRNAGFTNMSADLIFGIMGQTVDMWKADLITIMHYTPEHLSVYSLTVEKGTPLYKLAKESAVSFPPETESAEMFLLTDEFLTNEGYEHYEISNYSKPGLHSKHNSSYWCGIPYLGLGAGAHSYNNGIRSWNVQNIKKYITLLSGGTLPVDGSEMLTDEQIFLETVMLSLRTEKGLDLTKLDRQHRERLERNIDSILKDRAKNVITIDNEIVKIPRAEWLLSDEIVARLVK